MLTPEEDVEITSLRKLAWSISAIARDTGRDRKTVRAYLAGEREPGVRTKSAPDPFDRFEPYVRQRSASTAATRASPANCVSGPCGGLRGNRAKVAKSSATNTR